MFLLYFIARENSDSGYKHWSILPQRLEIEVITHGCLVMKLITKKSRKMKFCDYNHSF